MRGETLKSFIVIAVLILAVITGFFFGRNTAPVNTVIAGTETVFDTVIIQDTLIVEKVTKDIQIVTKVKVDTVYQTKDEQKNDSTVCYEFEEVMEDSAFVKCGVCSDSLPNDVDLTGSIVYVPPPKIITETFRVDTVHQKNHDWKMYAVFGALSFVGGVLISNR